MEIDQSPYDIRRHGNENIASPTYAMNYPHGGQQYFEHDAQQQQTNCIQYPVEMARDLSRDQFNRSAGGCTQQRSQHFPPRSQPTQHPLQRFANSPIPGMQYGDAPLGHQPQPVPSAISQQHNQVSRARYHRHQSPVRHSLDRSTAVDEAGDTSAVRSQVKHKQLHPVPCICCF